MGQQSLNMSKKGYHARIWTTNGEEVAYIKLKRTPGMFRKSAIYLHYIDSNGNSSSILLEADDSRSDAKDFDKIFILKYFILLTGASGNYPANRRIILLIDKQDLSRSEEVSLPEAVFDLYVITSGAYGINFAFVGRPGHHKYMWLARMPHNIKMEDHKLCPYEEGKELTTDHERCYFIKKYIAPKSDNFLSDGEACIVTKEKRTHITIYKWNKNMFRRLWDQKLCAYG